MHLVRAVSLNGFIEVACLHGIDGHRLLREAGLTGAMLKDPESRVPASPVIRMLEEAAQSSSCEEFGLLMASTRTFASLGPIALLLQHMQTVGDVIDGISEYRRHLNDLIGVDLELAGEVAVIKVGLAGIGGRQSINLTMGMTHLAISGASGGRWTIECVHSMQPAPKDLTRWSRMFAAPVQFDATFDGFSCAAGALDIGLPLANAELAKHARELLKLIPLPSGDVNRAGFAGGSNS